MRTAVLLLFILIINGYGEISFKDAVPFRYSADGEQIKSNNKESRYIGIDFVDFDNDKDLDLLSIDFIRGEVVLLENVGTPKTHDFGSEEKLLSVNGVPIKLLKNG